VVVAPNAPNVDAQHQIASNRHPLPDAASIFLVVIERHFEKIETCLDGFELYLARSGV